METSEAVSSYKSAFGSNVNRPLSKCSAEWDAGDRLPVRAWHVGALARFSNARSHLVK